MRIFSYSAVDSDGVPQSSTIKAINRQQAIDALRKRNLIVTNLKEEKKRDLGEMFNKFRGVPRQEKINFTRQLGTMIGSGLPINQALQILVSQTSNKYFANIITDINQQIDGGASLHDAMNNYENIFGRLYLSLIRAGESSGNLENILERLADTLEADSDFQNKVKGALIYPVIIVIVMLGVLGIMIFFVIPRLSELYDDLGADLPFMTQLLIDGSNMLVSYFWVFAIVIVLMFYLMKRLLQHHEFAQQMNRIQLKAPVFGSLTTEIQLTSFSRTLGMLLGSGIPLLEALDISKETLSSLIFREAVDEASRTVEKGKPLADAFRRSEVFPLMISEMLAIGEQTGKLEEILLKLSQYFETRATNKTDNLASAIEPIVMVALGIMVGFLIIALILPIYSLTSQF